MAKVKTPDTVEHAVDQAIGFLGIDAVAETIGKSAAFARKCANPDDERQINLRDALLIDAKCLEAGFPAPFAGVAEVNVTRARPVMAVAVVAPRPLPQATRMACEVADLVDKVQRAETDEKIDDKELADLNAAIKRIQRSAAAINRGLADQNRRGKTPKRK